MDLRHKEVWNGEYRGIRLEVVHWKLGWNYYIHIPIEQLPEDVKGKFNLRPKTFREHTLFNYDSAPIISDLDWHGGITFYNKEWDERGKVAGYCLGCDYMHSWDEGRQYKLGDIVVDAEHSIDKLWELAPNLKLRCAWNGKYYNADQVYYTDKGVCVALENKAKWEGDK